MEELLTCVCGNQSWKVYSGLLTCTKCGYEIPEEKISVTALNEAIRRQD